MILRAAEVDADNRETERCLKADLTPSRTKQLSDAMTVSKDLMANLLLAAGGKGGISIGGGGSN